MTTKIYSRLDPTKLLHMIVRDVPEGRTNLCPDEQFLQCAALRLPKGTTFRPHKHNWIGEAGVWRIPQESWFVHKGLVFIWLYDTDGTVLFTDYLLPGQASFTFDGGHNYQIASDDSLIFEYKTGPYINQEIDKTFI